MAWGAVIPGDYGKLFLTLFRIVAVFGISWWLWDSVRKKLSNFLITAIALILAGAVGNIIDSVFYGVIFNDSYNQVATAFAAEPYGTWFYGEVVDMFYFPIWEGNLPSWLPVWGGKHFTFFNAIFNVADVAISTGVGILIVFNKRAFGTSEKEAQVTE
jgi:signal peptidase II